MRIDAAFTDSDLGILMGFSRITGQKKIQLPLDWLNASLLEDHYKLHIMAFAGHIKLLQTVFHCSLIPRLQSVPWLSLFLALARSGSFS